MNYNANANFSVPNKPSYIHAYKICGHLLLHFWFWHFQEWYFQKCNFQIFSEITWDHFDFFGENFILTLSRMTLSKMTLLKGYEKIDIKHPHYHLNLTCDISEDYYSFLLFSRMCTINAQHNFSLLSLF